MIKFEASNRLKHISVFQNEYKFDRRSLVHYNLGWEIKYDNIIKHCSFEINLI